MTAAIKTNPWLFVAFEAVMCAPSGDQLRTVRGVMKNWGYNIPKTPEERTR